MLATKALSGLDIRGQVMRGSFVEQAFSNATDFTRPLQSFIAENVFTALPVP